MKAINLYRENEHRRTFAFVFEPEGALLTRGFHWINEWPNNL